MLLDFQQDMVKCELIIMNYKWQKQMTKASTKKVQKYYHKFAITTF